MNFKSFFSKNVGVEKENMTKEIYNEIINSTESLGYILFNKGFINYFKFFIILIF